MKLPPRKHDRELERLVAQAEARFQALTPEQQAEHRRMQAESFARAFAPCEHGISDWEECADCRNEARGYRK